MFYISLKAMSDFLLIKCYQIPKNGYVGGRVQVQYLCALVGISCVEAPYLLYQHEDRELPYMLESVWGQGSSNMFFQFRDLRLLYGFNFNSSCTGGHHCILSIQGPEITLYCISIRGLCILTMSGVLSGLKTPDIVGMGIVGHSCVLSIQGHFSVFYQCGNRVSPNVFYQSHGPGVTLYNLSIRGTEVVNISNRRVGGHPNGGHLMCFLNTGTGSHYICYSYLN